MAKYFAWTDDYVKWGLTWNNLVMYMATIPDYDGEDKKGEELVSEEDEERELKALMARMKQK